MHASQHTPSNGGSASSITAPIVIAPIAPIAPPQTDAPHSVPEDRGPARASARQRTLVIISVTLVLAGLLATSFIAQAALITVGVAAAALSTALNES